jgi:hypothetical protein
MLDTPCSEVVRRVLATHSIRQFPFHCPFRASTCSISWSLPADAHKSAASSRINFHPRQVNLPRPFHRKTKSDFCACAISFQLQYTIQFSSVDTVVMTCGLARFFGIRGEKSLWPPLTNYEFKKKSNIYYISFYVVRGPGYRSRCSDSLRAERSGDRIPMPRFSAAVLTYPGAHPGSYTVGTGSFPRVKRPGRGVDYPPHLAPRLKKE